MASTNQSPFYKRAEQEFLQAQSDEERLACLEIMIKECPKHKSSENMLKNLTMRKKRLIESVDRQKKSGKGKKASIKKEDMQMAIAGFPNSGKSSLFKLLTKKDVKISPIEFSTYKNDIAMAKYEDVKIQTIDMSPFPSEDKSLINSTDLVLLTIDNLDQIKESEKHLWKSKAKTIIIHTKKDLLNETEKRKILATLKSKYKKYPSFLISLTDPNKEELEKLKKTIFESFPIIRIYTKEPKKETSKDPMILKKDSTIEDAAEKILKGMSKKIKRTRIWGPSSKFGGQGVGLDHILKDKDVVEFTTK